VYKKGAFVAGQLSIVIKAGRDAQGSLASCTLSNEERASLKASVKLGKEYEARLEKHRKDNGL
jgi:hypothetical protein